MGNVAQARQIKTSFLLGTRLALSLNKIGGSAKQNENPSAFLLLGSRLALSLPRKIETSIR